MAIRMTGLVSGMDTDSLVKDLVKASSVRKDTLKKAQTKLGWHQDAWKSLNAKIHSFYTKFLSNLRLEGTFNQKKATIANSSLATVLAGTNAPNGTQTLAVKQLAKAGSLTGGQLKLADGSLAKGSTKLSELGLDAGKSGNIKVTVGGKETTITLDADSTVDSVVKQLNGAGVSASYDATNGRIFANVKDSGKSGDFTLTAENSDGLEALAHLGLLTSEELNSNPEYAEWANLSNIALGEKVTEETAKRAAALAAEIEKLNQSNQSLTDKNTALAEKLAELKNEAAYQAASDAIDAQLAPGETVGSNALDKDAYCNDNLTSLTEDKKQNEQDLSDLKAEMEQEIKDAEESGTPIEPDKLLEYQERVAELEEKIDKNNEDIGTWTGYKADLSSAAATETAINANKDSITANGAAITAKQEYINADGSGKDKLLIEVNAELEAKRAAAKEALGLTGNVADLIANSNSATAVRIKGQDAIITLNGAEFTSSNNTFNINGLTITAQELSDKNADGTYKETSINTSYDADGVYDTVKDFFKEYNGLINEMDALYNVKSSKGYEPLTDEEKSAMSDEEIVAWEKKIKDSLFRRDDTLGSVISSFKTSMMQSFEINGSNYSLSNFGIETMSYFLAGDNQKGAYHIDGDPDDATSSGNKDKLKNALSTDPDSFVKFFTKLTGGLFDEMQTTMKSTEYRSIYNVYDDKRMQSEYDEYSTKIAKQEAKLKALEDKYYKQFAAMETALSKLNSQSNSISSMLGG